MYFCVVLQYEALSWLYNHDHGELNLFWWGSFLHASHSIQEKQIHLLVI